MLVSHTKQHGIQLQELHPSIHQQGIVIFALKKSTGLCLKQEQPHSTIGLNFFATAITKNLNSFKISQLQKLQINTKITSKFSTHLHQNLQHIYTKFFLQFTKHLPIHLTIYVCLCLCLCLTMYGMYYNVFILVLSDIL